MPRWLVALIVAVLLPCYGLAAVGQSVALASDDSGHALAHWTDRAHHHDDDGTFHDDDSQDSMLHLQAFDLLSAPVLMPAAALVPEAPAVGERHAMDGLGAAAPPFIEGLRRPPRSVLYLR